MDDQRKNYNCADLVSRIKEGDLGAFRELYDLFGKRVEYFAMTYLKSKEDAEEIVQDVFVKIWQTRKRLNPDLSIDGYIFQIVKNLSLNKLRKKIGEPGYYVSMEDHLSQASQTEEDVYLMETRNIISKAIEALPPKRQQIYRLSRISGMRNKEIAEKLHISIHTVEGQLRKATLFVKKYFEYINLS